LSLGVLKLPTAGVDIHVPPSNLEADNRLVALVGRGIKKTSRGHRRTTLQTPTQDDKPFREKIWSQQGANLRR
jgi:hypothetical protein